MKKYEFIDITTADVAFIAYGKNLDELFANSALAMFEVMIDTKQIERKLKRKIKVSGNDIQALMFAWLNELLFFVDSENLAFSEFNVKVNEKDMQLEAECFGEIIDKNRHETGTCVKSCTYHKMEIKKNGIWKAQIILDI